MPGQAVFLNLRGAYQVVGIEQDGDRWVITLQNLLTSEMLERESDARPALLMGGKYVIQEKLTLAGS